ncbi:hypothetical protein BACEGG_01312 [Bacteroides eggerthii DSM 20697]|nr:hypothetical protein BACEGG_01312 [Bacteroides eggerthii DSM 20697]
MAERRDRYHSSPLSATLVYTPLKNTISLLGINRKFNRNKLAI